MTAAGAHSFEEIVVDVVWRPTVTRPAAGLSREQRAVRLQQIQRNRAQVAAEEAAVILRMTR